MSDAQPNATIHPRLEQALQMPRIAIESTLPVVDDGRFAAKAIIGQPVMVTSRIFADGHDQLAAAQAGDPGFDGRRHRRAVLTARALEHGSTRDTPHAPATAGACACLPSAPADVRRIGGDLLDRLELAGRRELESLRAGAGPCVATSMDAVESVIAWDLAAGF